MPTRPITLLFIAAFCVSASGGSRAEPLAGLWGARGAALEIGAEGAILHESCSDTAIGSIRPDERGRFSTTGQQTIFAAGPQRADVPESTTRVTVSGHVEGDTMTLAIAETGTPARQLQFRKGVRAKVIRCY